MSTTDCCPCSEPCTTTTASCSPASSASEQRRQALPREAVRQMKHEGLAVEESREGRQRVSEALAGLLNEPVRFEGPVPVEGVAGLVGDAGRPSRWRPRACPRHPASRARARAAAGSRPEAERAPGPPSLRLGRPRHPLGRRRRAHGRGLPPWRASRLSNARDGARSRPVPLRQELELWTMFDGRSRANRAEPAAGPRRRRAVAQRFSRRPCRGRPRRPFS